MLLQIYNLPATLAQRGNSLNSSRELRNRGHHRATNTDRGRTDFVAIATSSTTGRCIQNQINFAIAHHINDRMLTVCFRKLGGNRGIHTIATKHICSAAGGDNLEAQLFKHLGIDNHIALIMVSHRNEDLALGR